MNTFDFIAEGITFSRRNSLSLALLLDRMRLPQDFILEYLSIHDKLGNQKSKGTLLASSLIEKEQLLIEEFKGTPEGY
jgi:hypothetical protein